ncbi:hypothetical protein BpHYR1_009900 [Brachionus plicatilis]|uniref:Uncharacterized protein n=1 Tax=Brachionus plicatilis TaxID=10195 RepID=A0A3M7PLZ1_BRAPC|nr:hypothetical protein BpHYR1_009900 [Brachionus plicatilis]
MTHDIRIKKKAQKNSKHFEKLVSTFNFFSSLSHVKGNSELNAKNLQLAIVKLIDDENEERRKRRNQVTKLGIHSNT